MLIDKSEHTGLYFQTACVNRTAILWDDAVKAGTTFFDISKELVLMMAAAVPSETSVHIYQTARCYI
jgi:phosphoribosylpyrophosphate synthetase